MNRLLFGLALVMLCADGAGAAPSPAAGEERFRGRVREALTRLLADPDTLEVGFEGFSSSAGTVRFDAVRVRTAGASFDGLTVDRGVFVFRDLVLDRAELERAARLEVRSTTEVLAHAEISEGSLNRYVEHKKAKIGVDAPRVRLQKKRMHLSGSFHWKLGRISFAASGDFAVRGDKIHFLPGRFEMNRLAVPKFMIDRVVREINPILDLGNLPFKTRIDRIAVEDGRLVITGFPPGAEETR